MTDRVIATSSTDHRDPITVAIADRTTVDGAPIAHQTALAVTVTADRVITTADRTTTTTGRLIATAPITGPTSLRTTAMPDRTEEKPPTGTIGTSKVCAAETDGTSAISLDFVAANSANGLDPTPEAPCT
jgi:hypothetical protein